MSTLFLDSNILVAGLRSRWGLSKAVLSLCAARIHQLVLARHVISEVEGALLLVLQRKPIVEADAVLDDYGVFLDKAKPVIVPLAARQEVIVTSQLIRHLNDAPVQAAALNAQPD
jgi:predicted nucleic acid-binding protein